MSTGRRARVMVRGEWCVYEYESEMWNLLVVGGGECVEGSVCLVCCVAWFPRMLLILLMLFSWASSSMFMVSDLPMVNGLRKS